MTKFFDLDDAFIGIAVLQLVFILDKIRGTTHWSWWWVTSPLWITTIVVTVIISLMTWAILRNENNTQRESEDGKKVADEQGASAGSATVPVIGMETAQGEPA